MRRLRLFLPLAAFVLLAAVLYRGLSLDPTDLPSALIGRAVPAFELPDLDSGEPITEQDLRGQSALVNVWATWCYSCRVEHPYLLELADAGVPIFGLNYKDESAKAREWLADLGDPYTRTIADKEGALGLDLGVYGAPETYVVGANGTVLYRHVGVVDERVWRDILEPVYQAGSAR
ncbi:periplasmic protein thiol--disulphide oxidoreductase DsbE [Luminiphilus syltensis NOR5-1B]|uniref:Periplasmic protein thiol--disulphide oxidoreductase DsbE n=1 Tax=Luminiphilus syltensis NOR5-1B TaxID=565045 RepID=B8KS76_9GAMM|nr:DsbE family thiol:disulfide interchange protein [Luminiphilus syltensis]EED35265.1 periplasmic protein thiol--disulphide oxidoreductase DsbE [Luminiphilus syltensis NOR5-1B]